MQSKILTAKSMAKLLGQPSCTSWAGQMGKHKHMAFLSQLQSLWALTGLLEEKRATTLEILTQFESQKGFCES